MGYSLSEERKATGPNRPAEKRRALGFRLGLLGRRSRWRLRRRIDRVTGPRRMRFARGGVELEITAHFEDQPTADRLDVGGESVDERVVADDADRPRDAFRSLVDRHDRIPG